jgi:hypothetical protein
MERFHNVPLIHEHVADQAHMYSTIINDRWNEDATEHQKVRYVLNLINEMCHRDERYELVDVKPTAN